MGCFLGAGLLSSLNVCAAWQEAGRAFPVWTGISRRHSVQYIPALCCLIPSFFLSCCVKRRGLISAICRVTRGKHGWLQLANLKLERVPRMCLSVHREQIKFIKRTRPGGMTYRGAGHGSAGPFKRTRWLWNSIRATPKSRVRDFVGKEGSPVCLVSHHICAEEILPLLPFQAHLPWPAKGQGDDSDGPC